MNFYYNIDEVVNEKSKIDACLFSSVLPYLKEPYTILETIKRYNIKHIIIDRTYFLENEFEDILTIQKVPREIYDASYPAWFLSLDKFISYISKYYDIIFKWQAFDQHKLENHKTIGLGFLLKRKS